MMTAFTCLWSWNRSLTPTPGGGARVVVEGERGGHRKSWQTLTLRKMMMIDSSSSSYWMPGATISRRVVRRSRALLMLSICAVFAAAFARQKTADDAPAGQVLPWPAAMRTGNDAKASAAQPARPSFPRQSPFFFFCWGAEAAGAHSEEEEKNNQQQQPYAGGPHAVYGTPYTPHTEEEEEDDHAPVVPSHLIMRAAVEEALSTLEDKSHEAAEKKKKKNKHSPSTMQEVGKGLLVSYGEATHEPAEGEVDGDTFSADSLSGDDTLERGGSHDSPERWQEEHVGEIHEEVEHIENPADSVHGLHWRHRVHNNSGHGPKTPAEETFDQYDALLTLIDGGGPRDKEVGLDGDVLGAAADPMLPPAEAELGMDGIVGLKRANSRGLAALQPITVMLTAMLLAVALMLAHSQSDTAKEFFQQTVLPGRRQDPLNHVPHDMVNHRAGDRYLEPGYIADDLGEHAAVPQVVWMHGDDETTAAGPYGNNDFKIQSIEQRIILADPEKDQGEKSSHIGTSEARAYHAGPSVGDDTLREPFADPAGTVGETAYKNKKDDGDSAESSTHEAPESVESEDAEVGEHHE